MVNPASLMPRELELPARVRFGPGEIAGLGGIAESLGQKALVIVGESHLAKSGALVRVEKSLADKDVPFLRIDSRGEPEVATVDAGARQGKAAGCDLVIAIGGGRVLDFGKAVAGLIPNGGSIHDYLEGVGSGSVMRRNPLPFVGVPTTAGTGSEVSRNAVITSRIDGVKKSFRDSRLVAKAVILDPELAKSCPPGVTAAVGLDALTQLIEPLTGRKASALTSALALTGIHAIGWALPRAVARGDDIEARSAMAYASFISGITLAHAGLGAVHAFASPLGGMFPVPHSVICARLLPLVVSANISALRLDKGEASGLDGYTQAETALGSSLNEFCAGFDIPGFSAFGMKEKDIPEIIKAAAGGNMKNNPADLGRGEMAEILRRAL